MASATKTAPKSSKLKKSILTFMTIGAVGAVGAFASTALLSDSVSLATTAAHGGTLDLTAQPNNQYTVDNLQNMKPGDKLRAIVFAKNTGSLPGDLTVTTEFSSSTEAGRGNCFRYHIERGAGFWSEFSWDSSVDNVSRTNVPAGTVGVGGEGIRFDIVVTMNADCEIGSGLPSGSVNVNNNQFYGSSLLALRNAGHATADLTVSFALKQQTA